MTSYRPKLDVSASRYSQLSTHSSLPSDLRPEEASGAAQVAKLVNQETRQVLLKVLFAHPVLTHLRSDDQHALIDALQYYEIGPNEHLYEAGTPSQHLYFLSVGTVVLRSKAREQLLTKPGLIFGEQALYGGAHFESACTLEPTTFWLLSAETLQIALTRLRLQHLREAKTALQVCGLDYYLEPSELNQLAGELLPFKHQQGTKVVTQGEMSELLYFLVSGSATVLKDDCLVHVLSAGEYFGEQAILHGGLWTVSIEALEHMQCYGIEQSVLKKALGSNYTQVLYRNYIASLLDECEALRPFLSDQKRLCLIDSMRIQSYGKVVIAAGTARGEKLLVLLQGSLKTDNWQGVFGAEDLLSEEQLGCHQQDLLAENGEVLVAEIGRTEFFECLSRSSTTLDLNRVSLFADLSLEAKTQLKSQAELEIFSSGQMLMSEEAQSHKLLVIKSGSVRVTRSGKYLRTLSRFDCVGERQLLLPRGTWVTAVAEKDTECWAFAGTVSGIISEVSRFGLTHEVQSEALALTDLMCVEALDSGQFGCVCYALSSKPAGYAVKCVSRRRIQSGRLQHDLINERDVLLRVNHPMCVKLHRTLQDSDHIYFLQEYVDGELLHDVLCNMGQCTDMMAQFYLGCLVQIFEHLHDRSIVYRDLKPENLMVDHLGFLKLIDFGSAKVVTGRTRTVIGTPQFMAPEIVLGKAYSGAVDLWSLGVLLYDMLCGGVPWGEGQEDIFLVFQQVLSAPLTFPDFVPEDSPVRSLIAQLLTRDPKARASLQQVKQHEFMAGVDYESLRPGLCSPPYLPKPASWSKAIRAAHLHPKTWSQELEKENMDGELDLPVSRPGVYGEDWDHDF